jgi:hypothetical protein
MRPNMTSDVLSAISAPVITTALLARLDFKTESAFLWTGIHAIQPTGSGDSLLDGNTFDPIAEGVLVEIGDNTFAQDGSAELQINLAVPATINASLAAAQSFPAEYQGRAATIWRGVMIQPPGIGTPATWAFRRIRSGSMDKLEFQADGSQHNIMLTIESHQGLISNATNQTYLDQSRYDPNDTSQNFAASLVAANDAAPSKGSVGGTYGGYGAKFNTDEGYYGNQVQY